MANKKVKKEKNIVKIIITSIVLVIIFILCFLLANGFFNKEVRATKTVNKMASSFYEKYYYDKVSKDVKKADEFLKQFKDIGIVVSLANLEKYTDYKNSKNILSALNCNKYKTNAVIYPKDPYNKYSYKIKVNLKCSDIK